VASIHRLEQVEYLGPHRYIELRYRCFADQPVGIEVVDPERHRARSDGRAHGSSESSSASRTLFVERRMQGFRESITGQAIHEHGRLLVKRAGDISRSIAGRTPDFRTALDTALLDQAS
jgi:hypothetical protein